MLRLVIAFAVCSIVASVDQTNDLTKGIFSFASDLYQECAKSTQGNVIISPFSVSNALVLLSQATNGSTFDELKKGLHLSGDKAAIANQFYEHYGSLQRGAGKATLSIANQIYLQQDYPINKNFQEVAAQQFLSGIESVNFANKDETAQKINRFVENKTNKRITNLIKSDSLSADSRVILVNAIHFKAEWKDKFYEDSTRKGNFYISETETVPVDLMYNEEWFSYADLPDLDATALKMEYAESNFSALFVLPNSRTGLSALETKLNSDSLNSITDKLSEQKLEVWIPKFTVEYETSLNDALKNLGINEIFASNANLRGLSETGDALQVSDVVHKAFITVSEGGSEAAAATGVKIVLLSGSFNALKFRADHNFMYYIWDNNSKTIVFSGRVVNFN
ncbi:ovalbumin-related protein X-like [Sitodiplosis mosellana]|uniref:ovalbumin-related protein X-like n=1 Tax=Sitodiplosis mosellana TaxID=263140 RepID=UPI0024439023|nr:ovalbumin-related protein X-like [Sitodiplosis mosellana]